MLTIRHESFILNFNYKSTTMSVCVTIRTKNILKPDVYLDYLTDQGMDIVVTSEEYPTVRFGIHQEALRGIEVNKEENGLEVRVCSFASKADYKLFVKTVDALMKLTGDKAYLEDETEVEITDAFSRFDDEWIQSEQDAGLAVSCALIRTFGRHIVMNGLFCNFCLGPKLLESFPIPLFGEVDKNLKVKLFKHLCMIQWSCSRLNDTSTHLVLPAPDADPEKGLTISMITIHDGKVTDFDYVSYADLLGIIDMDDQSLSPVLVPFCEAWKILPENVFSFFDELQFMREETLTVDMVHEMMDKARHLQPDDLHYDPTYPGEGFDEKQNTVILMWNPDISSVKLDDHRYGVEHMLTEYFNWSVWDYQHVKCGDRFFLVRVGKGNTGIVMSGVFDSQPYEGTDWSGRGRRLFYIDMLPNAIIDPEKAPILTTAELQKAIPAFDWTGGASGRLLAQEDARKLESLWQEFLAKHADDSDGITMNVIHTLS